MKINHILTQLTEAKFDTVLTDITPWHNKSGTHTYLRTGRVGDFGVVISVKFVPIVPLHLTGACIEFGILAPGTAEYAYDIKSTQNAPVGQIFGAVINVLRGDLPAYWDFMYAEAKDSVPGRVRLYTTLFSRFASHYNMVVGSVADQYSGGVVMARQQDMKPIQQLASQIFLQ